MLQLSKRRNSSHQKNLFELQIKINNSSWLTNRRISALRQALNVSGNPKATAFAGHLLDSLA